MLNNDQKNKVDFQSVRSARIVASIILLGLLALLFHLRSKTDIGSAFGEFYLAVLIFVYVFIWIYIEIKRNILNK
jgi:hypothetical protein